MPIKVSSETKGLRKAIETLYNFSSRLDNYIDIKDAIMLSGVNVRDALNAASPDIKADYYQTKDNEVHIAPSVDRLMELYQEREKKEFEGTKRCLYLYYVRDVPIDQRLPTLGINKEQIIRIIEETKPIITDIFVQAIKRSIKK